MQGSLALHEGVLFVGYHERTAHVATFDLDGRPLGTRFSFRDERVGRSSVAGLAIDPDRRVWVADAAAERVRSFNLFGSELQGLVPAALRPRRGSGLRAADRAGSVGAPCDVSVADARALYGSPAGTEAAEDEPLLLVVSGGRRRHAVQVFRPESGACLASLRPQGDAEGRFDHAVRAVADGELIRVCEAGTGRVQVFRRGEFHFAFAARTPQGEPLEPLAIAVAPGERMVLLVGGARPGLLLLDGSGNVLRPLVEPRPGRARAGEEGLFEPSDLVLAPGAEDRETRVAVLDRDGGRVQVFNLEGRCYGAFAPAARD